MSFGAGEAFAQMKGSEANDEYALDKGEITAITNNNGGITGGITNGMPIVFSVAHQTDAFYKQTAENGQP